MTIRDKYASVAVLDADYRTGSIKDNSPSAHVDTIDSDAVWVNTKSGRALTRYAGSISANYAHSSDFDFNNKETTIVMDVIPINDYTPGSVAPIVDFFAGGGSTSGWFLHLASGGQLGLTLIKDGPTSMTLNSDDTKNDGLHHQVVIRLSDSAGTGNLSIDGISNTNSISWVTGTLIDLITSQQLQTHPTDKTPLLRLTIYGNTILTDAEISQLWQETQQQAHLTKIPTATRVPENSEVFLSSNIVAQYPMKFGNSQDIYDVSGNGYDLTSTTNGGQVVKGFIGDAIEFDSVNNVYINTSAVHPVVDADRTISCWFKTSDFTGVNHPLVMTGTYSSNNLFGLSRLSGSPTKLSVWGHSHDVTGTTTLIANEWYHAVVTYDSASSTLKTYINNELDLNQTTTDYNTSGTTIEVGSVNSGVNGRFNGIIDDVRIFNTALTADQVQVLYEMGKYKLTHNYTGQDWNETASAVSSPNLISNTGFSVYSGTHSVVDQGDNEKAIVCVTDGFVIFSTDSFYGSWEFDVYNETTSGECGIYIGDGLPVGSWNGYGAVITGGTNDPTIAKVTAGSGAGLDTGNPISVDAWHSIKFTRTAAGLFELYVDDVLEATTTDTSFTSGADVILLNMDAGDKIKNIRFKPTID
jgi:hypothetical protein